MYGFLQDLVCHLFKVLLFVVYVVFVNCSLFHLDKIRAVERLIFLIALMARLIILIAH